MNQGPCILPPIPLEVTAKPGVLINDTQGERSEKLPSLRAKLPRGVMEVQMPKSADVLHFKGPDFEVPKPSLSS
jgi:hypothetical protein